MNNYEFTDNEVYPIEASLWGTNAYYHDCQIIGSSPAFCICTNKLKAFDEGRLAGIIDECQRAIKNRVCGARAMRNEEVTVGKAIYFVNRKKLQEANEIKELASKKDAPLRWGEKKQTPLPAGKSAHVPHFYTEEKTEKRTQVSKPAKSRMTEVDESTGSYADAINLAIAEMPSPAPKPIASVAKAGMSMVEIARAALAQAKL